jgi:hypothetical protein
MFELQALLLLKKYQRIKVKGCKDYFLSSSFMRNIDKFFINGSTQNTKVIHKRHLERKKKTIEKTIAKTSFSSSNGFSPYGKFKPMVFGSYLLDTRL